MKKFKIIIIALCSLSTLMCCKNNKVERNLFEQSRSEKQQIASHDPSFERFLYNNEDVINALYPDLLEAIYSGSITVSETYFTNEMFAYIHDRAEVISIDTLFFIENFSDNKGFLIYSDWYGIIAVSDSGNIDISRYTSRNFPSEDPHSETLREIFSLIDYNAIKMVREGTPNIAYNDDFVIQRISTLDTNELFRPLVQINLSQDYPWNYYVNIHHHNCSVGCGPVAIGMMFSSFRYPSEIGGVSGDWNQIIRDCNSYNANPIASNLTSNIYIVANWLLSLGRLSLYTANLGTATGWLEMIRIIEDYPRFANLHWNRVVSSQDECDFVNFIKQKKMPIIMYAADLSGANHFNLHYFVIDGVAEICNTVEVVWNSGRRDVHTLRSYPLVHCNWGWGGRSNGYYRYQEGFDLSDRIMESEILMMYKEHPTKWNTENPDGGAFDDDYYNRDRKVLTYDYNE